METLLARGIADPPGVGLDRRMNPYQKGMFDLMGKAGWLSPPQNLRPLSQQSLTTMTTPASTMDAAGNPRITAIEQGIEMKMIFTAENEESIILGGSGIAPLTFTDQKAITTSSMKFHSHLPDRRPVRGRVRMGTFERKERIGTLSSFGSGIEFPIQFYMDRDGPLFFRLGIEQLNIGVRDFLIMMAYNMLENAIDWSSQLWEQKLDRDGRMSAAGIAADMWMQRESKLLGLLQRPGTYPMQTLLNFVQEQQFLVDNTTNVALVNHRLGKFLQTEIGMYTKQFIAGEAGPRLVNSSPDAAITGMLNVPVHVVRTAAAYDDGTFFDFMTGNRRYGEYVPMLDMHNPTKERPYRSYWRDTWILDSNTDDWCKITLLEAIVNSGRFNDNGTLRNMGSREGGWLRMPDQTASDPFHNKQDGNFVPIQTWGELTEEQLSDDDLLMMAQALRTNMGDVGVTEANVADFLGDQRPLFGEGGGAAALLRFPAQEEGGTGLASAAAAAAPPEGTQETNAEIALNIAAEPAQALRSQTGTWTRGARGGFKAGTDVAAAPLTRLGLLRAGTDGQLDMNASNAKAILAVGADVNYHYANPTDPAGTRNAHHVRGQILNVLGAVDTSGSAEEVGQRIGAAVDWLTQAGLLPQTIAQSPLASAPSQETVSSMGKNLSALTKRDDAKNIFANVKRLHEACSKTQRTASSLSDGDIVARIRKTPVRQVATRVAKVGAEASAPGASVMNARLRNVTRLTTDQNLQVVLSAFLQGPITLQAIKTMIARHVPVPLTPLLMRWEVDMMTAGMILATRGAQRTYYSIPVFSWTDDDVHQVSRGTLSFNAGAFTIQENRTYHVRDVLIVGVNSGFDCTFVKGGAGPNNTVSKNPAERGSIVSVLEPYTRAKRWPQLITAYGTWDKLRVVGLAHRLKGATEKHYEGAEFVRAWFGVDAKDAAQPAEQQAAYAGLTQPENLTMWRGGARYYDPVTDRKGDIVRGTGPIASYDFYDAGMFKAWSDSTAYPTHTRIAAVAQ